MAIMELVWTVIQGLYPSVFVSIVGAGICLVAHSTRELFEQHRVDSVLVAAVLVYLLVPFLAGYYHKNSKAHMFKELIALSGGVLVGIFIKVTTYTKVDAHGVLVVFLAFAWPIWYANTGYEASHFIHIVILGYFGCMASICLNAAVAQILFESMETSGGLQKTHYLAMGAIFGAIDPTYALKLVERGSRIFHVLTWEYIITSSFCSLLILSLDLSPSLFMILAAAQMKFTLNIVGGITIGAITGMYELRQWIGEPTHFVFKCIYGAVVLLLLGLGFGGAVIKGLSSMSTFVDIGIVAAAIFTCVIALTNSAPIDMFKYVAMVVDASFFMRIGIGVVEAKSNVLSIFGLKVMAVCICLTAVSLVLRCLIFVLMEFVAHGIAGVKLIDKDLVMVAFASVARGSSSLVMADLMFRKSDFNEIFQAVLGTCLMTNMISSIASWYLKGKYDQPPDEEVGDSGNAGAPGHELVTRRRRNVHQAATSSATSHDSFHSTLSTFSRSTSLPTLVPSPRRVPRSSTLPILVSRRVTRSMDK